MTHYYELRALPHQPTQTIGANIARHLQARQDLGKAIVISDNPIGLLSVVRKQWLHLARYLQRQRASTLNPEEILRLTHTIMHMQRMEFAPKTIAQAPDADVYFLTPHHVRELPQHCFTVYLASLVDPKIIANIVADMPNNGLLVNYDTGTALSPLGLRPKVELETKVLESWQEMAAFLRQHTINPAHLSPQNPAQFGALDDALDTLLDYSHEFLRVAGLFRQAIHLAQPLTTISAEQQHIFTAVMRLAHRVQTLSPDSFNTYLLKTFGEKESYFLRDSGAEDEAFAFFALPRFILEAEIEDTVAT